MEQIIYLQNKDGDAIRVVAEASRVYYSPNSNRIFLFTPIPDLKQYLAEDDMQNAGLTKMHPFMFDLVYLGDL